MRAVIDSITPRLPKGVVIEARISVADQLVVQNATSTDLIVLGEQGEPFLRIGPQGAFANLKSPTWYKSNDPTGAAIPPKDADPAAEPVFGRMTSEPAWGWFDHRLHRGVMATPPAVKNRKPVRLESWTVPMRYGDQAVTVKGHREYQFPSGDWEAKITRVPDGLKAMAFSSQIPLLSVFGVPADGPTVVVLGEADEPMARFAGGKVEVNEASPTWTFTAEAKGGHQPTGPVGSREPARWVAQSSDQVLWLDRRAQFFTPDGQGRKGLKKTWRLPVQVGDKRVEIVGETRWQESQLPGQSGRGGSMPWPVVIGVGLVVGVGVGVGVGRLRRRG
ncbi:MAG: hypothetical protein QOK43_2717 [Acidimicrobiaceae bacterium]|nr:hypothetical protein [Acidimicrobiaceae bacterium]